MSSRPGTAAKPTLVPLPSATLGWKLRPSEGFPGREMSPLQGWDLGQAGKANSICIVQRFVFLLLINAMQMKDGQFPHAACKTKIRSWRSTRQHHVLRAHRVKPSVTARWLVQHLVCPELCPYSWENPSGTSLSQVGAYQASGHPGTELSYASNICCWS